MNDHANECLDGVHRHLGHASLLLAACVEAVGHDGAGDLLAVAELLTMVQVRLVRCRRRPPESGAAAGPAE